MNGKKVTIISAMKKEPKHFVVNKSREGHFYLEKKSFESINDLVRYHQATEEAITPKSGVRLLNGVPKQVRMELVSCSCITTLFCLTVFNPSWNKCFMYNPHNRPTFFV